MAKNNTQLAVQDAPKLPAEMVIKTGTTFIVPVAPAELEVYEEDDNAEDTGINDVSDADRRLPILRILQPNSPQCRDIDEGGLGAKAGSIFNTQTQQVFDGKAGIYVIVAFVDHKFVNYKKRDENGSGGGFIGILEPNDPLVKQRQAERIAEFGDLFGKLANGTDEDGNDLELVETFYKYAVCVVPNKDGSFPGEYGDFFMGLLPFASTQIKKKSAWIERNKNMRYNVKDKVTGKIVPKPTTIWAHVWHVKTALEKRGAQSWYGWTLTLATKNEDGTEANYKESRLHRDNPLYKAAEELRVAVMEGSAQVAYEKDAVGEAQPAADQHHGGGSNGQNDIPGID